MIAKSRTKSAVNRPVALAVAGLVVVSAAACGSSDEDSTTAGGATGTTAVDKSAPLYSMLPASIRKAGRIIVAAPLSAPPFVYLDGDSLKGLAPSLSTQLESLFGVKFKWVDTPFPALMPGMKANKFDMLWGVLTDTKEREKSLNFIDYQRDGAVFQVKAGNPQKISGMSSLCGKAVSSLSGSQQTDLLKSEAAKCTESGKKPMDIRLYGSSSDAQLALSSGRVQVYFNSQGAAMHAANTAKNKFAVAGPVYQKQLLGAAFSKDDEGTKLSKAFQAGVLKLMESGRYKKVFEDARLEELAISRDQVKLNGGLS